MAASRERIVVIGAGHNGLVTACYLSKAGLAATVLERREVVGGTAVTEELYPGFHCPTLAHTAGPLRPRIVSDLQLGKHGLTMIQPDIRVLALHPDGPATRIYEDPRRTAAELLPHSANDSRNYPEFHASFSRLGRALAPLLSATPPDIDQLNIEDYLNLGKLGLRFRGLDKKNAYRLLRWGPMAVADLAAEWFETELLRAVVEAQGIFAAFAGPRSAGTSTGLLLQAAADGQALAPAALVKGGIGSLTQALARAATEAGAQIRTGTEVARIRVTNGRVSGVVLAGGEEIPARAVVSNADPRHTFLTLIDAGDLDPSFRWKVQNYRCVGSSAKVNLALSALPALAAASNGSRELSGRIHIGPDTDYLERAFDAAKYGDFSSQPYMDITIPSLTDPALAPQGAHVMSIHVQYAPYQLKSGDWNSRREEFGDAIVKALSAYAPNLRSLILQRQIITPLDLEKKYGLSGGHIFHGEPSLDQFFAFRPFLGGAQYRTPVQGLYLCGAGTHPGGRITGAPGANASREIIRDLK